ncbi:hypothetical protein [Pararhizobium sp. O133]|uniref:hypothetical protein n=1 Tax=Pararhizobium sp. O133 TaxID=3449278 RepID=UPI003F68928F
MELAAMHGLPSSRCPKGLFVDFDRRPVIPDQSEREPIFVLDHIPQPVQSFYGTRVSMRSCALSRRRVVRSDFPDFSYIWILNLNGNRRLQSRRFFLRKRDSGCGANLAPQINI